MTFLPFLKSKKDTRALVIDVLTKKWPLSAKEIYKQTSNEANITYQAVHKALKQLEDEKLVVKNDSVYELNNEWVAQLKELADDINQRKLRGMPKSVTDLNEGESRTITFDSVFVEPFYWMLKESLKIRSNEKVKATVSQQKRIWPLTIISEKENAMFRKLYSKGDHCIIAKSNRFLDHYLKKMWENFGVKCKLGIPCAENCDIQVLEDYVFQIYLPKKIDLGSEILWTLCEKTKIAPIPQINKMILESKLKTKFIVSKNKELAEMIRKNTMMHFK